MGQRLSIKVLDLLAAGCTIKQVITHLPADEQFKATDIASLHVLFPGEMQLGYFIFDFEVFDDLKAAADYSEWGNNFKVLSPILERLKVDHEVF